MRPFPEHPQITLLPEGALFLTDTATLVVADVHLGKSAAFRAKGLPVPEGDSARDFQRLLDLVKSCDARHLVIAGDFFHAPAGITPELHESLGLFLDALALPLTLVAGNHDTKIRKLPGGIESVPFLDLPDVRVVHDPAHVTGDQLHICGHWHPIVKIADGKRSSLRLPCFLLRSNTLVLPAFGSFTGGAVLTYGSGDRIFVGLRDEIIEVPEKLFC